MWGEGGGQTGREGMRNRVKGKKGGVWGDFQEERGGHYMHVHICVWSHGGGSEEMGGERQKEEMGDGRGGGWGGGGQREHKDLL